MPSRLSTPSRVACFTPLPPARTGVANYAAGFLPTLHARVPLDVFVDQRQVDSPSLESAGIEVRHARRFPLAGDPYDVLFYQMGNSAAHAGIYERLLHDPGVVQLHDPVLHHFHLDYYFHRGRARDYGRKLADAHGRDGATLARCVNRDFGGTLGYFALPMRAEVLRRSVGVIVHGERARRLVRREAPSLPILRIEHPLFTHTLAETDPGFRARYGLEDDAFVVTSLGFATPSKRIDRLLEASAALAAEIPRLRVLVVGEVNPESRLREHAARLGVAERLVVTGWVDDRDLWSALAASDVVANLRHPTAGEASGPLAQAMGMARPTLVSGTGAFLDVPGNACVRIPLGAAEIPALVAALRLLERDPVRRRAIGEAGQRWVARAGSAGSAASSVAAFLRALTPLSRTLRERAARRRAEARRRAVARLERRVGHGLSPSVREALAMDAPGERGRPAE